MEAIRIVEGVGVPLRRANVDTDQILPAKYLKRITKSGYEDALFERWMQDPDFVLHRPEYAHPRILVVGPEFGIGSSREHAVWALRDYGFRAVIGSTFGDIFRGNAAKQGLLVASMPEEVVERLWDAAEQVAGTDAASRSRVDLVARTAAIGAVSAPFEIGEDARRRLLEGLDDIAITLRDATAIDAFEARRPSWMPRTLPAGP